jgi:hypothetical protein
MNDRAQAAAVRRGRIIKAIRWAGRVVLALLILFALAVGFGTPSTDCEKMRLFADAVQRWQHYPDFRKVQVEYVEIGNEAMRTKCAFVSATGGIMCLRSLPGLPAHLRVNPTSQAHYENFTRGPLCAYLHLTGETSDGLANTFKMMTYVGRKPGATDEDIRKDILLNYKFDGYQVCSDDGAVQSVRKLMDDVDIGRDFAITDKVRERLAPHITAIAQSLGIPTEVARMTPLQQKEVWRQLDGEVQNTDYELWRTKQVNDWLNGVWAQVYGTMYSGLIGPTLVIRETCRVVGPMLLMGWVGLWLWRRKKAEEDAPPAINPRLAVEGPKVGDDDMR